MTNVTTNNNIIPDPATDIASVGTSNTSVGVYEDTMPTTIIGVPGGRRLNYAGTPDESLFNFFKRPVLISTSTWTSATFTPVTKNVLSSWTLNAAVAEKLVRYALMRGNLHIKITVNGNPLQYGALIGSWQFGFGTNLGRAGVPAAPVIARASQLRHVIVQASGSDSCELVIPTMFHNPYIRITSDSTDLVDFGWFYLQQLVPLSNATGATVTACTVQISAWVTEIELGVATYNAISAGEYSRNGVISAPATMVANVMSSLRQIPMIAKYAKATEIGARAVASVASLFGFSRPSFVGSYSSMVMRTTAQMAIGAGVDTIDKITLDPKQECDIDFESVSLPAQSDPLAFASIATRWMIYGTTTAWPSATSVGTQLFAIPVNPLASCYSYGSSKYEMSPLGIVAMPFVYWAGTIRFRITIYCSPIMHGRLLVWHYPHDDTNYTGLSLTAVQNTMHSCILDTTTQTQTTFNVHPAQSTPWLTTGTLASGGQNNGYFVVSIYNELSAGAAVSAYFTVEISGGEDFQVAQPYLQNCYNYLYNAASNGWMDTPTMANKTDVECDLNKGYPGTEITGPYFGEKIVSFRPLSKRYTHYTSYTINDDGMHEPTTTLKYIHTKLNTTFYPLPIVSGNTTKVWTWGSYIAQCFAGAKGGVRNKFRVDDSAQKASMWGGLFPTFASSTSATYRVDSTPFMSGDNYQFAKTAGGVAFSDTEHSGMLEFEAPYYSSNLYTQFGDANTTALTVHPNSITINAYTNFSQIGPMFAIERWTAMAEDFMVYEWIGFGQIQIPSGFSDYTYTATVN